MNQEQIDRMIKLLKDIDNNFSGSLMPWTLAQFRYKVCVMRSGVSELLAEIEGVDTTPPQISETKFKD